MTTATEPAVARWVREGRRCGELLRFVDGPDGRDRSVGVFLDAVRSAMEQLGRPWDPAAERAFLLGLLTGWDAGE